MTFFTDVLDASMLRRLASFARRYVSDAHEADDVAQDALLRAARSETSPREPERTEAWLFRICRHAAIDHVRSRRVRRPVWMSMPDGAAGPVLEIDDDPRALPPALARVLARLPAHHRLLMVLHYEHTFPQSELCRMTGLSPSALRVRLHRARQALSRESGGSDGEAGAATAASAASAPDPTDGLRLGARIGQPVVGRPAQRSVPMRAEGSPMVA